MTIKQNASTKFVIAFLSDDLICSDYYRLYLLSFFKATQHFSHLISGGNDRSRYRATFTRSVRTQITFTRSLRTHLYVIIISNQGKRECREGEKKKVIA